MNQLVLMLENLDKIQEKTSCFSWWFLPFSLTQLEAIGGKPELKKN